MVAQQSGFNIPENTGVTWNFLDTLSGFPKEEINLDKRPVNMQQIKKDTHVFMEHAKPPILLSIANGLTLGRLCAIPALIFFLANLDRHASYVNLALLLLVTMQASDVLDGFLARRAQKHHNLNNLFGQILDPAADKLYINSTCFTLSLTQDFPWWVTLTVFSKDLLIFLAWLAVLAVSGNTLVRPDAWGKAADTSQAFLIFAFLLNIPKHLFQGWGVITVVLTVISGITLIIRDIRRKRTVP